APAAFDERPLRLLAVRPPVVPSSAIYRSGLGATTAGREVHPVGIRLLLEQQRRLCIRLGVGTDEFPARNSGIKHDAVLILLAGEHLDEIGAVGRRDIEA